MKRSKTYPFQTILLIFILIFLSGCAAQNETSPTDEPPAVNTPPIIQETERALLNQFLAEPVEVAQNPNRINPQNIEELTFLTRFGDQGQNLVWSPDNKSFIVASSDELSLFDARSFTQRNTIHISELWENGIIPEENYFDYNTPAFNPNGKVFAFSAVNQYSDIILMDATTFEILQVISLDIEHVSEFTFSEDGLHLVGIIEDIKAGSWNAFSFDLQSEAFSLLFEEELDARYFALSPDGSIFVSVNNRSELSVWESGNMTKIATLDSFTLINNIQFLLNNEYIAIAEWEETVSLWDTSGNRIAKLVSSKPGETISSVAVNPTGDIIAIANVNGNIDIFDIQSGDLIKTIITKYHNPDLSFNADGSILSASTSYSGIAFWSTDLEIQVNVAANLNWSEEIKENFASLPAGEYILYTDGKGMSVISKDGSYQQKISDSHQGVPISADGRILTNLGYSYSSQTSGYINLLTGEINNTEQLGAISPDLKWIAQAEQCDPAAAQLGIEGYSIRAGTSFCVYVDELIQKETEQVYEAVSSFKWSPDASKVAFTKITTMIPDESNYDWAVLSSNALFLTDTTCFLDPRTCDQKTNISLFNPYKVNYLHSTNEVYLSWSPDGTLVALNDGTKFVVFDLKNQFAWKMEKPTVILENYPQYFGISPDNKWIAYSADWTNIVLQPFTDEPVIEIASDMQDVQVLGWIMAHQLKNKERFKVLPDGNHTRIYALPGFDRQQTGALYTNNTFTVRDGPVQEDGYTWWYVHSHADDVEGWVPEFYGWYEKVE